MTILLNPLMVPQKERLKEGIKRKKIIVISGPTGVGKTQLSLQIAQAVGGEIVSVDSMQIYRGMDVGTAKASFEERENIRHHLIDSREIDEPSNVMEFYQEASQAIKEILSRGAVPLLVGGAGFYMHALIYGPPQGPSSDPQLRAQLEEEMDRLGPEALFQHLKSLDSEYASTITSRDRHKIIRGLEIIALSQRKVSDFKKNSTDTPEPYDFRCWFLYYPRAVLYQRIEMRCDEMIQKGLIEEVKRLQAQGLRSNPTASQAIGYRQCLEYLDSSQTAQDWDRFVQSFKKASRRYAKRQLTWAQKELLFRWVDLSQISPLICSEMIIQDCEVG